MPDFGDMQVTFLRAYEPPGGTREAISTRDCYTITQQVEDFVYEHEVGGRDNLYIRRFLITNRATNADIIVNGTFPSYATTNIPIPIRISAESAVELLVLADIPAIKQILFDGVRERQDELSLTIDVQGPSEGPVYIR